MTEYARVDDVKAGDVLVTDGGFTCMSENEHKTVKQDNGGLFVDCSEKRHYLDGQIEGDVYIGLRKA